MTEAPFDRDVIQRRLREIHVQLDRLAELGEVDADRLRRDWITAAAVERVLGTIVELATDVNAHVVVASGRIPPQDYRSSFIDAAEAGWMDRELAERLAPSAGLRNVLAHRYLDIDPGQVAAGAARGLVDYRDYVRSISAELQRRVG